MPNTPIEDVMIQNALKLIIRKKKYIEFLPTDSFYKEMISSVMMNQNIYIYVKFMDNAPFTTNLSLFGGGAKKANCVTTGFTSKKLGGVQDEKEMFLNRSCANPTTIVHEMLHFFTHPRFGSQLPSTIVEAVTEYFTRKVLSSKEEFSEGEKAKYADFKLEDRKNRYDLHHQYLGMGRAAAKTDAAKPKDYMKLAYFRGDAASIDFIARHMSDLDDMLKDDA